MVNPNFGGTGMRTPDSVEQFRPRNGGKPRLVGTIERDSGETAVVGIVTDQLNSFLRGELSAVETYRHALARVTDGHVRDILEAGLHSHQRRADALAHRVEQLGVQPSIGSGAWGAFAKLVEGGAAVLGNRAMIAALEEGEDHGLRDYRADLSQLDTESRRMVEQELLPEQEQTHQAMSALKHTYRS
jgi:demethoxyubiquinone hydroxylase (CLK1/Coq7/Cat5 family)